MKSADLMESIHARPNLAVVEIGRDSPLADPERPGYVGPQHAANALFNHLEGRLAAEPMVNGLWHELMSAARHVRNQQLVPNDGRAPGQVRPVGLGRDVIEGASAIADGNIVEAATVSAPAVQIGPARIASRENGASLEGEALEAWVEAATKRESFYALVDVAAGAEGREEARRAMDSHVLKQAFVKGARKSQPGLAVPGFDLLWSGREGKDFQSAMSKLSVHAKRDALGQNEEIDKENQDRPEDELIARVSPRETMIDWTRQMNVDRLSREVVRTRDYEVVMQSDEEAAVMKGFVDIGLKAIDEKRVPSREELAGEVARLREEFSKPVYVLRTEVRPVESEIVGEIASLRFARGEFRIYDTKPHGSMKVEGGPELKPGQWFRADGEFQTYRGGPTFRADSVRSADSLAELAPATMVASVRATVRRPALTSPGVHYKGGVDVADAHEPAASIYAKLEQGRRIVGLEGQRNYHSDDVVRREMDRLVADRKSAPMMVSHAPEGSELRGSLVRAAERLGVKVMRAELKVSTVNMKIDTNGTRRHFDGEYATPMINQRETRAVSEMVVRFRADQPEQRVAIDSAAARAAGKGALVLVDVVDGSVDKRHESKLFQAAVNNAALVPNELVGFGHERHDKTFARVVGRREMSGYPEPRILDKAGNVMSATEVAARIAPVGATPRQVRASEVEADTTRLSTRAPLGQSVAIAAIGAERAAPMLAGFGSLGEAREAGARVLGAPKEAATLAGAYGVDVAALHGAAAFARVAADGDRFSQIVAEAKAKWQATDEKGTAILANAGDAMVRNVGPLVGFSSIRAEDGSLRAPGAKTIAIVGDAEPMTPNLRQNIDVMVAELADRYGRDEGGVARMRLLTTLSPGTGEAVMESALRHKVPVEAIGHKNDQTFKSGSKDLELFMGLASRVEEAGLGGTWSTHPYRTGMTEPSPEAAARVAMEAADATVVTRVAERDRLTLTIASVAQTRPVLVLPPSEPDVRAYGGNAALTASDRTIGAAYDMKGARMGPLLVNATYSQRRTTAGERDVMVLYATVDTKAGAPRLNSAVDVSRVVQAAEGGLDATMGRKRPMASVGLAEANRIGVRHDVVGAVDLDRFYEKGYARTLDLTPVESKMVQSMRMAHLERVSVISRRSYERLEERFPGSTPRERAESVFKPRQAMAIG